MGIIVIVLLFVLAIIFAIITAVFPIISGYGAKILCSAVFVARRQPANVLHNELSTFPLNLATFSIDYRERSVTGVVFRMAKRKAIYREGLGAALIHKKHQNYQHPPHLQIPPQTDDIRGFLQYKDILPLQHVPEHVIAKLTIALDEAFREPPKKRRKTRAVVIVHDGKLIAEKYAEGFNEHTMFAGWSMAKSITSALIGILVKQNKINPDAPAIVPGWSKDERSSITITHLLQMCSGLQWWEYYAAPSDATRMLYKENDMAAYAANKKLKHQPGRIFNYSSGTTNILSGIIRSIVSEKEYYSFPYEELFYKIGMTNTLFETDATGTFVGSSYCMATARDWARFGLLYLNDGVCNGERILPEGWVDFTTTPTVASCAEDEGRYGAHWWLNASKTTEPQGRKYPDVPEDCFMCQGHEGQYIWVIPSKKLVVVRLALEENKSLDPNLFLSLILAALE